MDYQEFLDYIKENIVEVFKAKIEAENELEQILDTENVTEAEEVEVDLHKVIKNNGIVLDGITLRKQGESISPNIYLNSYFESYQMGKPIASIMEEIIFRYQKAKEENDLVIEDVLNFGLIRDKIVIRLVNFEKNRELLKNCPHKKFLDLAVTFRYIVSKNAFGIASSLISNQEFEVWKIELEELYEIALFNTMREFPWHMDSLAKVMVECFRNKTPEFISKEMLAELETLENEESSVNMFVLTNDTGVNGATCILYDNVIKNFAKVQDSNIFLLPSSIHEMMLVPENSDTNPAFLADLVLHANCSAVGLIDLLSDNIYYYDRDKNQMFIYGEN